MAPKHSKNAKPSKNEFGSRLDRYVFATYFIGAVVPLLAMAWLAQKYVLPQQSSDGVAAFTVVGALVTVGTLSLGAFFALRRLTLTTLARIGDDQRRLERLLVASRGLARETQPQAVASAATGYALELSGASGAALVVEGKDGDVEIYEADSDATRSLYDSDRAVLDELAVTALREESVARLEGHGDLAFAAAVPVIGAQGVAGALMLLCRDKQPLAAERVDSVVALAALTAVALGNGRLQDSQRNFFAHTTDLLATALDQHVNNREGHAKNVARIANRLGRELGLDEAALQTLHYSCLLHDIGMLRIEYSRHCDARACRNHALLGYRMLSRIQLWQEVAPVVLHHHERWDGTGYPERLEGEAIPLAARIVAVADTVDAMFRSEGERPGKSLQEIVQEVESCSGKQFDPQVAAAFTGLARAGELELSL